MDAGTQEVHFLLPFDKYQAMAKLRKLGSVLSEEYVDEGALVTMRLGASELAYAEQLGVKMVDKNRK